jgi:hypothetical protein
MHQKAPKFRVERASRVTSPAFAFVAFRAATDTKPYGAFQDMLYTPTSEIPCIERRHLGAVIAVAYRNVVKSNTKAGRDMLWRIRPAWLFLRVTS